MKTYKIAAIPGASPLCPRCEGRLEMRSVQKGLNWWKLWVCDSCRFESTLTEIPRESLVDVTE